MTNKRKKDRNWTSISIKPFKQFRFGIYIFALSFVFVCIAGVLFWIAFSEQYAQLAEIFKITNPNDVWELQLNDIFKKNLYRIAGFFILFIMTTFGMVFHLTHRFYGPVVSIERFLDEITKGNYNARVKIRNNDELHSLVDKLNALAETLEKKK